MNNDTNTVETLRQYADAELKNHLAELNTHYQNETLDSESLRQAYEEHQNIFSRELEDKIQSLLGKENNPWLKGELENVKHQYMGKLIPNGTQ